MTSVSYLPIELLSEIMQCLHHYQDRTTLLSAALVSKDWCTPSQSVLFSVMTDHSNDTKDRQDRVMAAHIQFLQTITEYPGRLGPLVRSYAQKSLWYDPATVGFLLPDTGLKIQVWRLTENALPAMVNLKHLYLHPNGDRRPASDGWVSLRGLLSSFTFQLKTLTWRSYFDPRNGLPEFLTTQHELIHLDNGNDHGSEHLPWLDDGVCPNLKSVSCGFRSFRHVARTRTIIAWEWLYDGWFRIAEPVAQYQPSSVFDSLKYLNVHDYDSFRRMIGPINLNIILLELALAVWARNEIPSVANLPNLRVLVLIQNWDSRPVPGPPHSDIVLRRDVFDCFQRLPSLEYIIYRYPHPSGGECRYMKLSLLPDSTEGILGEEMNIHYDPAVPWWTLYNL